MRFRGLSFRSIKDRIATFRNEYFPALRNSVIKVMSSVQTETPPELGILGIVMAYVLICDELGINPHNLVEQARTMLREGVEGPFVNQIAAMRAYVKGELK